jgi:hypothetical protein
MLNQGQRHLLAVRLGGDVAESDGGHAGHGEVERRHVHGELTRSAAHLVHHEGIF